MRLARRLGAVIVLAALALALGTAPAAAHATLLGTDPADGVMLQRAPAAVTLRFSEPVSMAIGGVRVLAVGGGDVRVGRVEHPGGDPSAVQVTLPRDLHGLYLVSWRAISADSHPVAGAFTFTVGSDVSVSAADRAALLAAGQSGDAGRAVAVAFAVDRLALFAGLVVLLGALAFLILLWPGGIGKRRVHRLLWTALAMAAAATLVGVPLQGAYAAGRPLASTLDLGLAGQVLTTRFGIGAAARLVLLLVVAAWLVQARLVGSLLEVAGRRSPRQVTITGLVVAVGLLATIALVGHAGTGLYWPLGLATDLVHLAAVAVWLGGLAMLTVAVLPRGGPEEPGRMVAAFSQLAFLAVLTIVGTGVVQSLRQVGALTDLTGTTYGRLLLVKVTLVAGMVTLGAASRRVVQRQLVPALALSARPAGPGADRLDASDVPRARLRRWVALEALLAVVILAVTSLLVNAAPPTSSATEGSGGGF
jgi:copper transport protein